MDFLQFDQNNGLRAAHVHYKKDEPFDWKLFDGFDTLRALTYSASAKTIARLLDDFSFKHIQCVFGCEKVIGHLRDMLAFQATLKETLHSLIMNVRDVHRAKLLKAIVDKRARFWVVRQNIAHAKLYLLSAEDGRRRVISGSANLSERALSGHQVETLYVFEDDVAWDFHERMFTATQNGAADELDIDPEQIERGEPVDLIDAPALAQPTIVMQVPTTEQRAHAQAIERVDKIAKQIPTNIQTAPIKNGAIVAPSRTIRAELTRLKTVSKPDAHDSNFFSLDLREKRATLSGRSFSLAYDQAKAAESAKSLVEFWASYEEAFEGNSPKLQRDYFTFASWLYFAPLMCDLRTRASLEGKDVIRYPRFAVIFGKSNCGKTSLIDLLMYSMFGRARRIDKNQCTRGAMLALEHAYKRLPVYFDDVSRARFRDHVGDTIKNEWPPDLEEYPCFLFSMNASDPASYPDEVVKRVLMIHTTTSLPQYREDRRQAMQEKIERIRNGMSHHFYLQYLSVITTELEQHPLPDDWLALSSRVLSTAIGEALQHEPPAWCRTQTWQNYAEHRYDRVKERLANLLRPDARLSGRATPERAGGWRLQGDNLIIVLEQTDNFGRTPFNWEEVPSSLYNEELSTKGRTVLYRKQVENFIAKRVGSVGIFAKLRRRA